MAKLFLLAAMAGLAWTANVPAPNVTEIVERSTQQTTANWNQSLDYSFVERDAMRKHDSKSSIKTYEVLQIDGSPYNRLSAIDDKPLSGSERDKEDRKLRDEVQRRQRESEHERTRRVDKYLKARRQDRALLDGMLEAFDFGLIGHEVLDGRECWVMDAKPKSGYQPKSKEGKVLAGMRGRFWIDQVSGNWVKVQAEVYQTVSLSGFFAKVRPGTRFLLEQEPVSGSLWLPKRLITEVSASALGFINENYVQDETYSNYKLMPEALARIGR